MTNTNQIALTAEHLKILKEISRSRFGLPSSNYTPDILEDLENDGLIEAHYPEFFKRWEVTQKGRAALRAYQVKLEDRKADYLHDWKIAIFSVLGGALLSEPLWMIIKYFLD